ncbi:MAG TPA: TIR domain-containing protein [Thermoanaerobaculia bacterium]|nr:TIR domain-containing protein [Thermoanaerobaculia bacterium]
MSFEFDVFVSYSRRDSPFVESLVGMLRDAGFAVWFDIEQVPGGADVQQTLLEALDVSRHVVAVITESWLESDYTTWEVSASQKDLHGDRVLVPLARMAFDARKLGPFLHRRNVLSWLEGDREADARFWEVYCALLQKGPGPKAEWAQKGRAARKAGGGSVLPAASPGEREVRAVHRARWGAGRAVLGCDRAPQWSQICTHADRPQSEALFVVGPRGEGHELFLETIHECFPAAPPRQVRTVRWSPVVPSSRGGFRAELAEALDCGEAELAAALRSSLRDQNLILVHRPVLAARLRDEGLTGYYTRWLPELLGEVGATAGALKVVQGIDWCPARKLTGSFARLAGRLGIGGAGARSWIEEALQQDEAERALARIRKEADPERLPVFLLEPLRPITRTEIETWSESLPPGIDRTEIVRDALSGANDSSDVLRKIAERLGA